MFSFNSPQGMCLHCDGLGTRYDFDPDLLVPDPSLDFFSPCIVALRHKPGRWRQHIYLGAARHLGVDLQTPWRDLPASARHALLYGTGDAHITFEWRGRPRFLEARRNVRRRHRGVARTPSQVELTDDPPLLRAIHAAGGVHALPRRTSESTGRWRSGSPAAPKAPPQNHNA